MTNYSDIFNRLRDTKKKLGAAEALLTYAKTRSEKKWAQERIAVLTARRDLLESHFEYA